MPISSWSTTAADNDDADAANGINWSEGQAPGQVNDSARAMMAEIRKLYNTPSFPSTITSTIGAIYSQASAGQNANILLTDENGGKQGILWWDRTSDTVNLNRFDGAGVGFEGSVSLSSTKVAINKTLDPVNAIQCRQGSTGGAGANTYHIYWSSGAQLWIDTTNVGTISVTSDYRIKQNVTPLPSTWETVKALNPITYTDKDFGVYKADGKSRWGFVAHELQDTLGETAATGVKDSADELQSPQWAPVVAALTKALQEAQARIEALEAR